MDLDFDYSDDMYDLEEMDYTETRNSPQRGKKSSAKHNDAKTTGKGGKFKFKIGDSYKMFTEEQVHDLLDQMEENPQLWDKRHADYKDTASNLSTWRIIEKELGFLVVDRGYRLKKIWTALIGAYRKQRDLLKGRSGSGSDDIGIEFEYFSRMKFVESAISSSAPSPSIDSTRNITKRLAENEKIDRLSRKRCSKKSEENDEFLEFVRNESRSIDSTLEELMKSLKNDEKRSIDEENRDIVDKVVNTLNSLDSSDKFDCKVAIAQVCNQFLKKSDSLRTLQDLQHSYQPHVMMRTMATSEPVQIETPKRRPQMLRHPSSLSLYDSYPSTSSMPSTSNSCLTQAAVRQPSMEHNSHQFVHFDDTEEDYELIGMTMNINKEKKIKKIMIFLLIKKKKLILDAAEKWIVRRTKEEKERKKFKLENLRNFMRVCNRLENKQDSECREYTFIPKQIILDVKTSFENVHTANNFKLTPFQMVVIFFQFITGGESFCRMSRRIGVSKTLISNIISKVSNTVNNRMSSINCPKNAEEWREVEKTFERKNMLRAIGSLDGKHIRIRAPPFSALVDANGRFIWIDVGTPGSVNDATIFNQSELRKILDNGSTIPSPAFWSEQVVMPSFIIGDGIFPLLTNLMKPFSRKNLSNEEMRFNKTLSNARVKVEHAFGMQSGKFRCLRREIECSYDKAVSIVIALCNLHNMILKKPNETATEILEESAVNPYSNPKEQREALKFLLNE